MQFKKLIKSVFNKFKNNSTAANILIVGGISVIVKVFGFYKEVVIAGEFGLSEILDTFFIALLIPGFVNQVFLSAFKSVFIPNYIAEKKINSKIGAFQSTSFVITITTSLVFMVISYLITDVFLETFFPGKDQSYYNLIKIQFYYLLPCILLWGLSSLLSGLLNIYKEFTYSSLYPIITSVSMVICIMFYKEQLGVKVLAIGMLIGSIGQVLLLFIISLKLKILKFDIPDFKSANALVMFKQVPAKVSSGFLTGLIPVTDQFFAAQLVIGSIAALNYGLKIPTFFSTLAIIALGNVLLPYFSKLSVENPKEAFNKLDYILKRLFFALIIISISIMFFSDYIVTLFFERNNFTQSDTQIVSNIQQMFLIGIPFTICGNIVVRFLTSINRNTYMAYVSLVSIVLNVILDFLLMKVYGAMGIALCTAILQILRSIILYNYALKQKKIMITN